METIKYVLSKHAHEQIRMRNISEDIIMEILLHPDSMYRESSDLLVIQKVVKERNKPYLYRVFVNTEKHPNLVVTAYKTSKLFKYEN
jgi:hypothetical protein